VNSSGSDWRNCANGQIRFNSDHTKTGTLNCVSEDEARTLHHSLLLIKKKVVLIEKDEKSWDGKTTDAYRASFKYNGTDHSIKVTDPLAINWFRKKSESELELTEVYLCLSLTEPWPKDNNRCHKLIAAVMSNSI